MASIGLENNGLTGSDEEDDMDYMPTTDGEGEDQEFEISEEIIEELLEDGEDEDGEDDDEFQDASEGEPQEQPQERRTIAVTRDQLLQFLQGADPDARLFMQSLFANHGMDDDDDDDASYPRSRLHRRSRYSRKAPRTPIEKRYPPIPNPAGSELMSSGIFGMNEEDRSHAIKRRKHLATNVLERELGLREGTSARNDNRYISQDMIPSAEPDIIIHYDYKCYSGQFSDDGNFFFSCDQNFKVRMYDTSNPYDWKYYKKVTYPMGNWTITDASLSPDNKYLAYSSISSVVCLAPTDPGVDAEPFQLDFGSRSGRRRGNGMYFGGYDSFGIWSVRFSGDGREIVAGTSASSVIVYDVETRQPVLNFKAHDNDVNAVCFADKSSPHILYSGSDDATLKVWDRRSMSHGTPAGVFVGHTEGLTYVDSKGDGRYVLSNGKDQTMKLWDLRKMYSWEDFQQLDDRYRRGIAGFDYRGDEYDEDEYVPDPKDCSVVTYRGHRVLKTLIRCHFSPPGSTNSRYVYTGSRDGGVYIYNLDGTLAKKIDVQAATVDSRPKHGPTSTYGSYGYGENTNAWLTCVRDVSWHPTAPVIAAISWNGYGMRHGTCTVHSWADQYEEDEGEPRFGIRVDDRLRHNDEYYKEYKPTPRRTSARLSAVERGDL